jgi:uncharacterized protein with von Willebrand factor type A (vWA) domain
MTAADYDALEARVAELEHQLRNVLTFKLDAVSYGVSVAHGEMTEQFGQVREQLGQAREQLGQAREQLGRIELTQELQGEHLASHGQRFDSLDRQLAEILRRLPGGPGNAQAGAQDDH